MFNDKIHNLGITSLAFQRHFIIVYLLAWTVVLYVQGPPWTCVIQNCLETFPQTNFFRKKRQTIIIIIITYSNKGFLLSLFVKNKKFLSLLPQKSSFHSCLFQRNVCNFVVLCKAQLAVHKVFWETVPNVLQTHLVANLQQPEKMPFLKECLGIKSPQFYWEMLIEIILPTVNKTFFFISCCCFMLSYRNRAGYFWHLSNLVSLSLSLKSSSTTTHCWAKWLVQQIVLIIWQQLQRYQFITFVYLDLSWDLITVGFFSPTLPSIKDTGT